MKNFEINGGNQITVTAVKTTTSTCIVIFTCYWWLRYVFPALCQGVD